VRRIPSGPGSFEATMMTRAWLLRTVGALVLSVVVPFLIVAGMTIIEVRYKTAVPSYGTAASIWMGIASGLVILGWRLRWKLLIGAFIYVPLMYWFLLRAAIVIWGNLTGDWP
jgi:hypothetical protein